MKKETKVEQPIVAKAVKVEKKVETKKAEPKKAEIKEDKPFVAEVVKTPSGEIGKTIFSKGKK